MSIFRSSRAILFIFLSLVLSLAEADVRLDGGSAWDTNAWRVQVDGVMGGDSSGSLRFEDATLVFSGDIVLDGGGFSSVRRDMPLSNLTPYAGIEIVVETTEAYLTYPVGMHLQFHDQSSSYGFASAFAIPMASEAGLETKVYLPLESFDRGSVFGFSCTNGCALDTSTVNEMDLYVLFQNGPFEVRVKSITAVENAESFPSPVLLLDNPNSQIQGMIEATLVRGGALFDYGYGELCIAIYRSTLNSIVASNGATDTVKSMACQGLERAETQAEKFDVAWALRYTLDGILEELGVDMPSSEQGWRPDPTVTNQCFGVTSFGGPPIALETLMPTPITTTQMPIASPIETPTASPSMISQTPAPTMNPTPLPMTAPPTFSTTSSTNVDVPSSDVGFQEAQESDIIPIGVVAGASVAFLLLATSGVLIWRRRRHNVGKAGDSDEETDHSKISAFNSKSNHVAGTEVL